MGTDGRAQTHTGGFAMGWEPRRPDRSWLFLLAVVLILAFGVANALLLVGMPGWCAVPLATVWSFVLLTLALRQLRWLRMLGLVCCGAASLVALVGYILAAAGVSEPFAYLAGAVALLGVLFVPAGFRRGWVRWWLRPWREALQELDYFDLRAARRAAGSKGRVFDLWHFFVWTDIAEDIEETLREAIAISSAAFTQCAGIPEPRAWPLRILCFARQDGYVAYTMRVVPSHPHTGGYYEGQRRCKVVVCANWPVPGRRALAERVAHEYVHHLARCHLDSQPPVWLGEGLATICAASAGTREPAPGAAARYLRTAKARGDLLDAHELRSLTYASLMERYRPGWSAEDAAFVACAYLQSACLVQHLLFHYPGSLPLLLAQAREPGTTESQFELCFGMSFGDVVTEASDAILGTAAPPYQAPSDETRSRIDELVPISLDPQRDPAVRTGCIMALVSDGYPWRAGVLVDILEQEGEPMRAFARMALENLAGELRGEDPAAWREWLALLPEGVVAEETRQ